MKKKKVIIVGIVSVVAMLVIAGLLVFLIGKLGEDNTQVYSGLDDIKYISYTGEMYEGTLVKEKGKWYWKHDKELPVDQEALAAEIEAISKFMTVEQLEEAESLKEYGLDKPYCTITFKTSGGRTKTIYIGNQLGDDAYYATVNNKKDVYVVTGEILMYIDSLDVLRTISEDEAQRILEDIGE